jgi:hypothetical protein
MDNKEREQYQQAFASLAKTDREALASLIVEYLQPMHITTDFVGMLLNTRNLAPGTQLVKKVRKGITVRTFVPGSIHLASEVTVYDRAVYNLGGFDVKVHANEWEIESGEIGSLADIENEMRAKIKDYFMNLVFNALANLWNFANTPNNWVSVGGPLTAPVLQTAVDEINYQVGSVKAIVGTRRALTPITTFGNYVPYVAGTQGIWGTPIPSAVEEIARTGFLGSWYGCKVVALDQIWDNELDHNAMLPEDKVLVVGNNVGEFITYGDVKVKQWQDMNPTPPVFKIELWGNFGMIIDHQEGIFVIDGLV